jgi:hypothetical protein
VNPGVYERHMPAQIRGWRRPTLDDVYPGAFMAYVHSYTIEGEKYLHFSIVTGLVPDIDSGRWHVHFRTASGHNLAWTLGWMERDHNTVSGLWVPPPEAGSDDRVS